MPLTPKQERFCHVYIESGNAAEAYRTAYDVSQDTKAETVWNESSKLLADPMVSARVAELKAAHADRHGVTVDSLLRELEEARTIALAQERPQTSAAVAATMGKARITGKDKQIIEHLTAVPVLQINRPERGA